MLAQDRLFTYTYQSTVLNKGNKEIEVWNTYRTGRDDFYNRLDHRTEFEIGLGSKLQTAFYLNLTSKTSSNDVGSVKFYETENEISFSNEWKLKLLDPVANPIGMALYGEYSIGSKEYALEAKIILDKKINKFVVAANAIYELELKPVLEADDSGWEKENKADFNFACAYSFSQKFSLTLENSFKNVIEEGEIKHSALYSGLGLSHMMDNFWLNFTIMPQIKSFKGEYNHSLNLVEFEKVQFRLIFSYVF